MIHSSCRPAGVIAAARLVTALPAVLVGALLMAVLAACGSESPDGVAGQPVPAGDAGTTGSGPPGAGAPATGVSPPDAVAATSIDNPCTLLTAGEVRAVIGEHDGGRSLSFDGGSACMWSSPGTAATVVVGIGAPGSAPGGVLAEPDYATATRGPDGIRYATGSGSVAEFAIGDRQCEIQLSDGEADSATAVRLAGLVRSRLT
ncbi:hypothetical protein [Plantactinospora sp. GCM10030261]|uniref:hypothetical protein n=1 Tax=Plantactinospora sp. GCM10030261 TaxID=3273420 RepID=UPI00361FDF88